MNIVAPVPLCTNAHQQSDTNARLSRIRDENGGKLAVVGFVAAAPGAALASARSLIDTDLMTTVNVETSLGNFTIELDAAKAPKTVANFLEYVDAGHYDGTIFHRVIDGFMVQGGGYDGSYAKRPTRTPVDNEADNGLKNQTGTVAMARTSDPHSATAQFFVNVSDNAFLDHSAKTGQGWGYCVFGKVTAGMDVVAKIEAVPTGPQGPFGKDAPLQQVVITSVKRG